MHFELVFVDEETLMLLFPYSHILKCLGIRYLLNKNVFCIYQHLRNVGAYVALSFSF